MFTGIIQFKVVVQKVTRYPQGLILQTSIPQKHASGGLVFSFLRAGMSYQIGESIALNGVCLTLSKQTRNAWFFDLSRETLEKSNFNLVSEGTWLNGERALKMSDHLGGHMVSGHVDGQATVVDHVFYSVGAQEFSNLTVKIPPSFLPEVVLKGSITLNGVSLTIAQLQSDQITLALIPATLQATTLRSLQKGAVINFETDLVAKYINKMLVPYESLVKSLPLKQTEHSEAEL